MSKRTTPSDEILSQESANGMNGEEIGKKYGVSKTCVCRHLKRLGLSKESPIGKKGDEHSMWKGGRSVKSGYWTVYAPDHLRAMGIRRVFEHILVAEEKLGRPVGKQEHIHHINLDRLDNRPENLHVFPNSSVHMQAHSQLDRVTKELIGNGTIKFSEGRYYL